MGLRLLIPVVILAQLYGVYLNGVNLPKLVNNRLNEGAATKRPDAFLLQCGAQYTDQINIPRPVRARLSPSNALVNSNFGNYGFTAGPMSSVYSPKVPVTTNISKFKFNEVQGIKKTFALSIDPSGEEAYWLRQGGSIDIPKHPSSNEPKYVFTPDFSGCSWTVTPMREKFRLRHVQGDKEGPEFNQKSRDEKGGDVTYAMQYLDYGYDIWTAPEDFYGRPTLGPRVMENVRAFAYMRYAGGRWQLHVQQQLCVSVSAGSDFKNGLLSKMRIAEYAKPQIIVRPTIVYNIPN